MRKTLLKITKSVKVYTPKDAEKCTDGECINNVDNELYTIFKIDVEQLVNVREKGELHKRSVEQRTYTQIEDVVVEKLLARLNELEKRVAEQSVKEVFKEDVKLVPLR